MEMSGLFALVAITMVVLLSGRPRAGTALLLATMVLAGLTFWHHATDTLAISL